MPGLALRLYYLNFTLSFLATGFIVGLLGGTFGSGGEMYDFHTPFIEEISGEERLRERILKDLIEILKVF